MIVGINCGHTKSGPGSGAVGVISESEQTRLVGYEVIRLMREQGNKVIDCTIDKATTQANYLQQAVALANRQDLDWFISIHFNSAVNKTANGVECYTYKGRQYEDAIEVCDNIASLGFRNRGVKEGTGLYVINKTKAKSILIEVCFVNGQDAEQYLKVGYKKIAEAICQAITNYIVPDTTEKRPNGTLIMGEPVATSQQLNTYLLANNKAADTSLAEIFLDEGKKEGIRGDIAFCQSIHETGFFNFKGDVNSKQNNFAGLGAVGNGAAGAVFATARLGIRAQIQHLKGYATKDKLNIDCVDPRYDLLVRYGKQGTAQTVESLAGKWAVPGYSGYANLEEALKAKDAYGDRILKHLNKVLNIKETETITNEKKLHRVQVGAFSVKENADKLSQELKLKGYDNFIV